MPALKLSGPQTIVNVDEAHTLIKDSLAASESCRIQLHDVTEVDLSFIQLLISARKTANARGVAFACVVAPGDPLADALVRAGLDPAGLIECEPGEPL